MTRPDASAPRGPDSVVGASAPRGADSAGAPAPRGADSVAGAPAPRGETRTPTVTHRGGCHCGAVAFEVDAPADIVALDCNCSICRMTGFLHLIVPRSRFQLLRGEQDLTEYTFNTGVARHLFCRRCGVKSF